MKKWKKYIFCFTFPWNTIITIESKDGRDVIDTEISKEEFFDIYGKDSKEER